MARTPIDIVEAPLAFVQMSIFSVYLVTIVQLYCLVAEAQLATPGARDGKKDAVCVQIWFL